MVLCYICTMICYNVYNNVLYNVQWRVIYCTITCYICYIVYSSVTQCTIACYTVYMSALLSVQKCDMVLCYAVNFNIYLYKLTIIVFIKKYEDTSTRDQIKQKENRISFINDNRKFNLLVHKWLIDYPFILISSGYTTAYNSALQSVHFCVTHCSIVYYM